MSIDGPRFAAFLAFTQRGMTPDDASACVMALHPLDDAPIPGRAFEKAARSRSRSFAKDAKRALPAQALTLAHSALADYKALAQQHGEAYYQTRYDQYFPGRESAPPEARVTPPKPGPAPSAPPPQAGSAPSAGGLVGYTPRERAASASNRRRTHAWARRGERSLELHEPIAPRSRSFAIQQFLAPAFAGAHRNAGPEPNSARTC